MQKGMAGLRLMYRGYIRVKTVSCPDLLLVNPTIIPIVAVLC
jgi:hypothetical protein